MLNEVRLIGNVGKDPDIRATGSGTRVANLSVATSERWKDKATGELRERTEWHRIVAWGDGLVGFIERYIRKGMQVYVAGSLQTRKWQDQSGVDRYSTEIVVQGFGGAVRMLGRKPSDRDGPPHTDADAPLQHQAYDGQGVQPAESAEPAERPRSFDDEIPF